jgi:diadenosine tetraphosphatase ApaH/serine/threonine PP2A family protein phosphatase
MLTAVIADVHANLAALEAVLRDIDQEGAGEILCLGDSIGYGPDPEEVVREVRRRRILSIQGNHEYAIRHRSYFLRMNPDPQKSLEKHLTMLSRESLAYLTSLETVVVLDDIRLVHGCPPRSPTCYLFYPSAKMLERIFGSYPEWLCFHGHTHTLSLFKEGEPPEKGLNPDPGVYRLDPGRRYIINPGSVGQPRDPVNNHAKYLLWDREGGTVTFKAVPYDVQQTVAKLRRLHFPSFNADRLI